MSLNKEIHIVSFTIPHPPNYGGVIDVFYKIKALYELGIKINLHCFKYDRTETKELSKYCKSVYYYDRPKKLKYFFSRIPFIVNTRANKELLKNLQSDKLPILFEGLHTTYFINDLAKNNRNIIVRTHNIEHDYYKNLAQSEKNIFRRIFFSREASKLRQYEKVLQSDIKIAAISEDDCSHFKSLNSNTFLIEAFHPNTKINIKSGIGDYILFHGNLSINENIKAAQYIIKTIIPKVDFNFKFAGKNPDKGLLKYRSSTDIEILDNPTDEEMHSLIQNAHINLLITFQDTGIKLKLLNALFNGRHCLVNNDMVLGTGFESLCIIGNSSKEIVETLNNLLKKSFSKDKIDERSKFLLKNVNNKHSAQKLINLLD